MMRLVTDDIDTPVLPDAVETDPAPAPDSAWPGEAEMILSAMDAARPAPPPGDRRGGGRRVLRGRADLRLYANPVDAPPVALYMRDVSPGGLGFITKARLPLGYGGLVRLTLEDGHVVTAACSVYRCRPAVGGWYEGALHFTNRQPDLG